MAISSLIGSASGGAWLPQFGGFQVHGPNAIDVTSGAPVNGQFHAEAHYSRVLGADFSYSATIVANWGMNGLSADLQFRISDEGRYGVRLREGRISFYRFMLAERTCNNNPLVVAPCPQWPPMNQNFPVDHPVEEVIASAAFDRALPSVGLRVVANGTRFTVSFYSGAVELGRFETEDRSLGVGRFGIYVLAPTPTFDVRFVALTAVTDPTARSNFTLLYSVAGYDARGTKRALVRTLNDIPPQDYDEEHSWFTVRTLAGEVKINERRFDPLYSLGSALQLPRTLGMQFLSADFTDLRESGTYTIEARIATTSGVRELRCVPFEILPGLVSARMLHPLSILNAEMRNAAEDDFRRNWRAESGSDAWSVGLDGAFVATGANDVGGAVLRRVFDMSNHPLDDCQDFRFVVRVTIVSGCDAQLQFRIRPDERWGVTLQAGLAGGCTHGDGPGALRLHREGLAVPHPNHFQAVDSRLLSTPFEPGRPYDVEVRATGTQIEALLDGVPMINYSTAAPARGGAFALKAWDATARFSHAKVWARNVALSRPEPGVWIPYLRSTGQSSQGFEITVADTDTTTHPESAAAIGRPLMAQQHGFNDCNNVIGEITSHSVFLSALMDVWATRAGTATPQDQERLRRAIVTAVLYFRELRNEAGHFGAYAHQEPGRAALGPTHRGLATSFATYGLSSFVDKGAAVDAGLVREALCDVSAAWDWLHAHYDADVFLDSVVAIRIARAYAREGLEASHWFERAHKAASAVLDIFGRPGVMADALRPTLRTLSWFEGVYEVFFNKHFELTDAEQRQLEEIVKQLVALANDRANGFCVIPQADDERDPRDPTLPRFNWDHVAEFPLAAKPIPHPPVGDWYVTTHFPTAAADCVYIGRLSGERALERLATGNLYWIFGLNPGIPSTKLAIVVPPSEPWTAASFLYNGPGIFARTIEGHRTIESATKSTLAPWEERAGSRHRETWWFNPMNNGYATITNGHVLREGQWHYWSIGVDGWVCGETFMLTDAAFLRAALVLEDWHSASTD